MHTQHVNTNNTQPPPTQNTTPTTTTITKQNAERLGEALEVALQDEAVAKAHPPGGKPRPPNPLMLGMTAPRYILFHLRLVKGPDLEQALLVLTLDAIRQVRGVVVGMLGGLGFAASTGFTLLTRTKSPSINPKPKNSCCATWRRCWRRTWRWSSAGAASPSCLRRTTSRFVGVYICVSMYMWGYGAGV